MLKTCAVNVSFATIKARYLVLFCTGLLLSGLGPAQANTLYRCLDRNGTTAYTNTRSGYHDCKPVGNFPARQAVAGTTKANTPPSSASSAGATTGVEFRTAPGDGEPAAVTPVAGTRPEVKRGAVYKFERNGVVHYTNRKPAGQRAQVLFTYIETCFACSTAPSVDFNEVGLNLTAYAAEISGAAARHGVDEALVRAVIHAESAFNPNAISRAGAQGLMQLMPATASRFGVTDVFTPGENIEGGVSYLAWLSTRFNGDLTRITAGYNAGEGAVDRYDGVPPYRETILYVERVAILRERYRKELDAAAKASVVPPAPVVAGDA